MAKRITVEQAVRALRSLGAAATAKAIAASMSDEAGEVTSRAVATALRQPVSDGRVTINFKRRVPTYRFIRLIAKGKADA